MKEEVAVANSLGGRRAAMTAQGGRDRGAGVLECRFVQARRVAKALRKLLVFVTAEAYAGLAPGLSWIARPRSGMLPVGVGAIVL